MTLEARARQRARAPQETVQASARERAGAFRMTARRTTSAPARARRVSAMRECGRPACPSSWRRRGRSRAPAPLPPSAGRAGITGQHGIDRRGRAFQHGGEPRHLGGHVVDALAQDRILHAFVRPGGFGFALHLSDFALQLRTLLVRLPHLFIEQCFFGPDRLGGDTVAVLRVRQRRTNLYLDLVGALGLVTQLVRSGFTVGQRAALLVKPLRQLLHATLQHLRSRAPGNELALELADASAELVGLAALLAHAAGSAFRFPWPCWRAARAHP